MVIDCCVIILTCLFPPIGVFLVSGIGADLVINMYVYDGNYESCVIHNLPF